MDRKELVKNLKEFKEQIKKKYGISKIILFGSRTGSNFREDSDVDLIVVGKFDRNRNLERAPPLHLAWQLDLPVDFLCYTPKEFNKLKKRITIVREALKEGIEIK